MSVTLSTVSLLIQPPIQLWCPCGSTADLSWIRCRNFRKCFFFKCSENPSFPFEWKSVFRFIFLITRINGRLLWRNRPNLITTSYQSITAVNHKLINCDNRNPSPETQLTPDIAYQLINWHCFDKFTHLKWLMFARKDSSSMYIGLWDETVKFTGSFTESEMF